MAQVPSLPSNGQPIDTQYLYDIVSSLISINGEIATSGTSDIESSGVSNISTKTNNLKIQAKTQVVVVGAKVSTKTATTGQVYFNTQFTQVPVATATLVAKSSSKVKATLTITGVDTSAVYYKVDYDSDASDTSFDINVIAIGV